MAHQLIIEVEDSNILPSLRKILNSIKGVSVMQRRVKKKEETPLSAYEQSLDDVRNGRLNTYASAEEFLNKMGILMAYTGQKR